MGFIQGRQPMKHTFTDSEVDAVTVFIDDLCIRCDRDHTGRCPIGMPAWRKSLRFQLLKGMGMDGIVRAVRKDRAIKTLGG